MSHVQDFKRDNGTGRREPKENKGDKKRRQKHGLNRNSNVTKGPYKGGLVAGGGKGGSRNMILWVSCLRGRPTKRQAAQLCSKGNQPRHAQIAPNHATKKLGVSAVPRGD